MPQYAFKKLAPLLGRRAPCHPPPPAKSCLPQTCAATAFPLQLCAGAPQPRLQAAALLTCACSRSARSRPASRTRSPAAQHDGWIADRAEAQPCLGCSEEHPCLSLLSRLSGRSAASEQQRADDARVEVEQLRGQRLAEQVWRDGREGPEPAVCSNRDGYEMALPSSGESVGGGEADGQRRARWAACTHGVRASAVMLHGIPAGEHAPGGRSRSISGTVDELRAAGKQSAAERRPPTCPPAAPSCHALAGGTAALNLCRAQP